MLHVSMIRLKTPKISSTRVVVLSNLVHRFSRASLVQCPYDNSRPKIFLRAPGKTSARDSGDEASPVHIPPLGYRIRDICCASTTYGELAVPYTGFEIRRQE